MRYIAKTLRFVNDNFLYLFLFALPSAVLFTLHFDGTQLTDMLLRVLGEKVADPETINLLSLYASMGLVFNDSHILVRIASLAVLAISVALLFSYCDRRMRIGVSSFRKPFEKLNENVLSIFVVCFVLLAVYELYVFLAACIFALVLLMGHLASQILLPILIIAFFLLFLFIATIFVQWIPVLMIPGSSFKDSLAISAKSLQGRLGSVFLSLVFPFVVTFALMLFARYFLDFIGLKYVVYALCYAVQLMYICSNSMVVFFDITGRERMDLRSPYETGR